MNDRVGRIAAQWERERPDLDVSPQRVIGRLHRLGDLLRSDLLAGYGAFGLGEGEFDVLATLRRAGEPFELAPVEIARHTMVTTGAATKRLDRLEQSGLVARTAAPGDARAKVVRLTSAGRELIDEAFTQHIAREHRLLADLDPSDREHLELILARWLAALEG